MEITNMQQKKLENYLELCPIDGHQLGYLV
jgi:hypothetical protein